MWDKLRARRRLGRQLTFWYHPRYEAPSLAKMAEALGIVALRGKRVLAELAGQDLVKPGNLKSFPLISLADLGHFHSAAYLERVGHPETLAHIFGILPSDVEVDEILGAVRWAVSGTLIAARSVLAGPAPLAINLGGGFHHAEPDMGSGFCVYNDIGVAIRKIRGEGFTKNIAIIDLDFHQGNGNIVGFFNDPTVVNYSLHGAIWTELEGLGDFNRNLAGGTGDADYIKTLEETLPVFLAEHAPGLVFYIAGNDVLQKDLLGEFKLSLEGVEQRDRMVLQTLRKNGIPAVVTLGGGYSEQAAQATLNLSLTALGMNASTLSESKTEPSPRFRKIMANLDAGEPRIQLEENFSDSDLWGDLSFSQDFPKSVGQYSAYEIERQMEGSGYLDNFRKLGFDDFRVRVELIDKGKPKVQVSGRRQGAQAVPFQALAEITWKPEP